VHIVFTEAARVDEIEVRDMENTEMGFDMI